MDRFDDADIQNFIKGGKVDEDEPRAEINDNLTLFNRICITEVHAPEVLEYQQSLIDELKQQLLTQQIGVNQMMDLAGESGSASENFTATLYQMDIERIRYSLSRYLRTRLLKIENNLDYIIQNPDILHKRLSENEQHYAVSLYNLTNRHFEEVVFNSHFENNADFRSKIESSDDRLKHSIPILQDFVFCVSNEDIYDLDVGGDGNTQYWTKGDVQIYQYSVVQEYVLSGKVYLL